VVGVCSLVTYTVFEEQRKKGYVELSIFMIVTPEQTRGEKKTSTTVACVLV